MSDRHWVSIRVPKVLPWLWAFAYPLKGRPCRPLRRLAISLYFLALRVDHSRWDYRP